MLMKFNFEPTYFKTRNNLYEEFYKPCMENSIYYDRLTGYFSSSIFMIINSALKKFIENNGKIRVICSPILNDTDIEAIINGYKEYNENDEGNKLNNVIDELSNEYPNTTLLLFKLISLGIIQIKLSIFTKNSELERLVHDKAGVFTDNKGYSVAFRGSFNETYRGLSEYGNSESFDAFTSWDNDRDAKRVNLVKDHFNKMWNKSEPNIRTYNIPEITIEKIKAYRTEKTLDELILESSIELNPKQSKWFAEVGPKKRNIRKHQEEILNNWEANNRCGIFQMCTGSGKTFTALCAIRDSLYNKNEVPIILVPSELLFNQWYQELKYVFGDELSILKIGSGNPIDKNKIRIYTSNNNAKRCILAIYQSASKQTFIDNVNWGEHIFLVCDEVHNIGSKQNIKLTDMIVGPRIGLSATPKRYLDEKNTIKIIDFFEGILEPKYEMSDAIKDKVLCEYFYYIHEVNLTLEEQDEWNRLTRDINKKIQSKKNYENYLDIPGLEILLYMRADILKNADQKLYVAEKILKDHYKDGQRWLVYLDDAKQVTKLKNMLLKTEKFRGNVFEYHTKTEGDLEQTLVHFESMGSILLAINCLDEGVDIPSIEYAIILASSKNPRQYIQRRGRVLRKSKNKRYAYIHDCFVSPNSLESDYNKRFSIVRGEIARAMMFAKDANNSNIAKNMIKIIINKNNIEIEEGEYGYDE